MADRQDRGGGGNKRKGGPDGAGGGGGSGVVRKDGKKAKYYAVGGLPLDREPAGDAERVVGGAGGLSRRPSHVRLHTTCE